MVEPTVLMVTRPAVKLAFAQMPPTLFGEENYHPVFGA